MNHEIAFLSGVLRLTQSTQQALWHCLAGERWPEVFWVAISGTADMPLIFVSYVTDI
jgi:hypothetical protein